MDAIDRRLVPVAWLREDDLRLWLVFHQERDWPRAFFAAGGAVPSTSGSPQRSLPGLRLPRLYLYAPSFRAPDGGLKPFAQLAVDQSNALFEAYATAHWSQRRRQPALAAEVARLSADLGQGPLAERSAALEETVLEFVAHLVALSNELARAERRGIDLCREPELPLVRWWRQSFAAMDFPILWTDAQGAEHQYPLGAEARRWAAKTLLGRPWQGDPGLDLALCRPS